ncbi:hypothetical protein [Umezakia ovalisporum]|uniref:Uncharacterized protein n=1 Tax=Umezakia ovalisporum FSS-43 TaxID=2740520 RepID=A0ABT6K8H2_9CYAN|nr:hypothetical protein [Umezakia ovalisporum]MDH6058622.1 hypothetical protein [Umezakia ovalisporum FSS-43]
MSTHSDWPVLCRENQELHPSPQLQHHWLFHLSISVYKPWMKNTRGY